MLTPMTCFAGMALSGVTWSAPAFTVSNGWKIRWNVIAEHVASFGG
jgi:hypothetical protein